MKIPNKTITEIYDQIGSMLDEVVYESGYKAGLEQRGVMNREMAYKFVFDELSKNPMFQGHFDYQHGSADYMCGIMTVMEHVAMGVSHDFETEFTKNFLSNLVESRKNGDEKDNGTIGEKKIDN